MFGQATERAQKVESLGILGALQVENLHLGHFVPERVKFDVYPLYHALLQTSKHQHILFSTGNGG